MPDRDTAGEVIIRENILGAAVTLEIDDLSSVSRDASLLFQGRLVEPRHAEASLVVGGFGTTTGATRRCDLGRNLGEEAEEERAERRNGPDDDDSPQLGRGPDHERAEIP